MPKTVTAHLSDEMVRDIEEFMKVHSIDRSTAIKELLKKSIDEWKIERAISEYVTGDISMMKASEMAGLSIWNFLHELQKKNITINVSLDLEEESLET